MRRRTHLSFAVLGAVLALAAAGVATAPVSAATNAVIADCDAHGALTKTYTIPALRQALSSMSAATKEYTNCSDVINRALAAAVSGKGERYRRRWVRLVLAHAGDHHPGDPGSRRGRLRRTRGQAPPRRSATHPRFRRDPPVAPPYTGSHALRATDSRRPGADRRRGTRRCADDDQDRDGRPAGDHEPDPPRGRGRRRHRAGCGPAREGRRGAGQDRRRLPDPGDRRRALQLHPGAQGTRRRS